MRQVEGHDCLRGIRNVRSVLVVCSCQWTAVPVADETAVLLPYELAKLRRGEIGEVALIVH